MHHTRSARVPSTSNNHGRRGAKQINNSLPRPKSTIKRQQNHREKPVTMPRPFRQVMASLVALCCVPEPASAGQQKEMLRRVSRRFSFLSSRPPQTWHATAKVVAERPKYCKPPCALHHTPLTSRSEEGQIAYNITLFTTDR
ncbi:hypothetical protein ACJBU6_00054 [Exserohilum turcicum]